MKEVRPGAILCGWRAQLSTRSQQKAQHWEHPRQPAAPDRGTTCSRAQHRTAICTIASPVQCYDPPGPPTMWFSGSFPYQRLSPLPCVHTHTLVAHTTLNLDPCGHDQAISTPVRMRMHPNSHFVLAECCPPTQVQLLRVIGPPLPLGARATWPYGRQSIAR